MSKIADAGSIKIIAGVLCLDFLNTVHCYGCTNQGEYLKNYQDLIDWSRHIGTISNDESEKLSRLAIRQPAEAKTAHFRAIALRETVYRIFTMALENKSPDHKDLAVLNKYLSTAMMQSKIVKTETGFNWNVTGDKATLDRLLNPVVRSVADLLISEEFKRIKKCADPICGWLFLDTSRNKSRRWCDMRDCGNRAKASRFYKKNRPSRSRTIPASKKPSQSTPRPEIDRHLL